MTLINLVLGLLLTQYIYFAVLVGRARELYGVAAPATAGHPVFERHYRVQMNTLELLVVVIPALYGFAFYWGEVVAASLGGLFLVGRFIYAASYVKDPRSRTAGFALSMIPAAVLVVGILAGALRELIHRYVG
jgi:hypothetical protein